MIAKTIKPVILPIDKVQMCLGGCSRQQLYELMRKDPSFPVPIKTSSSTLSWFVSELDTWMATPNGLSFNGKKYIKPKQPEVDKLLAHQNGCCAICDKHFEDSLSCRGFHIDHCHETNQTRGLLCPLCNTRESWARKNFDRLMGYINNPPAAVLNVK